MKYIKIILILIVLTTVLTYCCSVKNNKNCNNVTYNNKYSNIDYPLFQKDTFGGSLNYDICSNLTNSIRCDFLQYLYFSGISCDDSFYKHVNVTPCDKNNMFKGGKESFYYQVEHIVDQSNMVNYLFPNTTKKINTNILGNLILANNGWNGYMGNRNCKCVLEEKRSIYGNCIVNQAINNIIKCNNLEVKLYPTDECKIKTNSIRYSISIEFIALICVAFIVAIVTIMIIFYGKLSIEESKLNQIMV